MMVFAREWIILSALLLLTSSMESSVKPFLKWAGGKYRQIHRILATLPEGKRLVEPFAGSGAVFVNASHDAYILGDGNPDLVGLYTHLQQDGDAFISFCEDFFREENNNGCTYYRMRDTFNASTDSRLRAALFLYLNRHGYNGLCRYNQSGKFNVPFGRYRKPYFPRAELEFFHQKSQRAHLIHADFRETMNLTEPGDAVYCDPPYVPLTSSASFTSYTPTHFGTKEHIELAQMARSCARRGVAVVISNHDTPFTREQYHDANIISFQVRRHISCIGAARGTVSELLAVFLPS